MIRTSFRKQEKKPLTLVAYFILMTLTYMMQVFSTHKLIKYTGANNLLLKSSKTLFWFSLVLWFIVWQKDPGFLKKD
jgi:hypothetical protein